MRAHSIREAASRSKRRQCRTKPAIPPRSGGVGSWFCPTHSPYPCVQAQPHHGWSWKKSWKVAHPWETQSTGGQSSPRLACGMQKGRPGSCSAKINSESVVLPEVRLCSCRNTVLQISEVSRKQDGNGIFSFLQQLVKQKMSGAATHTGSVPL